MRACCVLLVLPLIAGCGAGSSNELQANGASEMITASDSTLRAANDQRSCLRPGGRLIYADVVQDPETLDLSGFEITLVAGNGSIASGTVREATGEFGGHSPLTTLQFDSATSVLRFDIRTGPDPAVFVGRFSCDSVWGELTVYGETAGAMFRRIEGPISAP